MLKRVFCIALWIFTIGFIASCAKQAPHYNSIDITGANYSSNAKIMDHDGKTRMLSDFQGKYLILFFGFTKCPAVCPTTLAKLAEVKKKLGNDGSRVQVLLVTVDPERDTAEVMKNYVKTFDPTFIGLRGNDEQIRQIAKDFHIFYQKAPMENGDYMMEHTAMTYILDPQNRVRLAASEQLTVDQIAEDIKTLMKQ